MVSRWDRIHVISLGGKRTDSQGYYSKRRRACLIQARKESILSVHRWFSPSEVDAAPEHETEEM